MNRFRTILGLAGVLLVAVLVVYGWLFFGHTLPKADALEKIALEDKDAAKRQQAASDLISLGTKQNMFLEPVPNIRRVLEKSTDPEVRALMILGITQIRDWDSMPKVIDALADDSVVVRVQACNTVQNLLACDVHAASYDPRADEAHRRDGIPKIHERWDDMKATEVRSDRYSKQEQAELARYSKDELAFYARRFHDQVLEPYHKKLKELNIPTSD